MLRAKDHSSSLPPRVMLRDATSTMVDEAEHVAGSPSMLGQEDQEIDPDKYIA